MYRGVPLGVIGVKPSEVGVFPISRPALAPLMPAFPVQEVSPSRPWVMPLEPMPMLPGPNEEELRRKQQQDFLRMRYASFEPPKSGAANLAGARLRRSIHPFHAGGMDI